MKGKGSQWSSTWRSVLAHFLSNPTAEARIRPAHGPEASATICTKYDCSSACITMPIRQMFEKKEGEWGALFAANETDAAGTSSQSTRSAVDDSSFGTEQQILTATPIVVEAS